MSVLVVNIQFHAVYSRNVEEKKEDYFIDQRRQSKYIYPKYKYYCGGSAEHSKKYKRTLKGTVGMCLYIQPNNPLLF